MRTPGLVKAQHPVYTPGDANANAFADCANASFGCRQPQRPGSAQIQSVLAKINLQCFG
jgi:hypothetical protein